MNMENEKNNIKKTTFWNYVVYFTFYSVIGWCYEVFLEVVVYRWGFSNRGVLFGPYTPVYGVGALAFLLLVYPVIRNKKGGKKLCCCSGNAGKNAPGPCRRYSRRASYFSGEWPSSIWQKSEEKRRIVGAFVHW